MKHRENPFGTLRKRVQIFRTRAAKSLLRLASFSMVLAVTVSLALMPAPQNPSAQANTAPASAAQARWLDLPVLTQLDLVNLGSTYAHNPGNPTPPQGSIDLTLLNSAVNLNLGSLQLPVFKTAANTDGLLDFGNIGALKSFSTAASPNWGKAATGLLTSNGALDLDAYGTTGANLDSATIDLSALLSQLTVGITTDLIDTAALNVGAVGSQVHAGNLNSQEQEECIFNVNDDYVLTDLTLDVHSRLLQNLSSSTRTLLNEGVVSPLNTLIGSQGFLSSVLGAVSGIVTLLNALPLLGTNSIGTPQASINFDPLYTAVDAVFAEPLSSDDGILIDLQTGTIKIDLGKFAVEEFHQNPSGTHWIDLSSLPANTEALNDATITNILNGVTGLLAGDNPNSLSSKLTRVINNAVLNLELTINIPLVVGKTCLPLVPCVSILETTVGVKGSLGGFLGLAGYSTPVIDLGNLSVLGSNLIGSILNTLLSGVLGILNGLIPVVGAILNPVLLGSNGQPGLISSVQQSAVGLVGGVLTALVGSNTPSPGTGALRNLLNNIATITINRQPTVTHPVLPLRPGDLGTGSFTVRALEVVLLPNVSTNGAIAVELASSTALATPPVCLTVAKALIESSPHDWALNAQPSDWLIQAQSEAQTVSGRQSTTAALHQVPVHPGDYVLSESASAITGGLPTESYTNSWLCTAPDGSPLLISETDPPTGYQSAQISLPPDFAVTPNTPAANAPTVMCTVTNTLTTAAAEWQKTDSGSPANLISGSTWALARTSAPAQSSIPITRVGGSTHTFAALGLPVGSYTLTEVASPVGYKRLTAPISFTVEASGVVTGLPAQIKNAPIVLPELPLSGGWGASNFITIGLMVLLGAAVSLFITHYFSKRSDKQ